MILPEKHDPDSLIKEEGENQFAERVQSAKALSEYFFDHFSKDMKLAEFEHRSSLKNEAEGYLKQLPIGAFRELMFNELSRLYKLHVLDHEAVLAYNRQIKGHRQKTNRLSLASYVMALLIQNPGLISIVERENIDWDYLYFEGIEKFKSILNVLLKERPANYGVLAECYRGHPDEAIIKKMATFDFKLSDKEVEKVFLDALDGLFGQAISAQLDKLFEKDKREGLTQSEKSELLVLLTKKHKTVV